MRSSLDQQRGVESDGGQRGLQPLCRGTLAPPVWEKLTIYNRLFSSCQI